MRAHRVGNVLFIYLCFTFVFFFFFNQVHLGDTPHNLTESDFEMLAHRTEGFSGSDISVCVSGIPCWMVSTLLKDSSLN